ncbi:Ankyrin-2 [Drechslerella dactyloides]|uniref:Ankyrin-2 n=1 Tax=Drechslerella dactyloides TaxID=74499 RepID=A0AAD6NK74_DREDA|nr:Ankyrin-2 [Drechslerella dactyloides]
MRRREGNIVLPAGIVSYIRTRRGFAGDNACDLFLPLLIEIFLAFFLITVRLPCASAFSWDDFTNNFATDLAPLITLFGEQVTKQFLSESLDIWDNLVFAMAPLGLLTAVVSVIRVCGSPSLRAFIGRAQESPSTIEADLLSCTSESTAEVFDGGGITRTLGDPQILEVVVKSDDTSNGDGSKNPIVSMLWEKSAASVWREASTRWKSATKVAEAQPLQHLTQHGEAMRSRDHHPNLSLNVGIVRLAPGFTYAAAALGVLLQTGVLVFGAFTVYKYPESFLLETGQPADNYAFPVTFVGTILMCFGLFLCAYIIERSSEETHFKRDPSSNSKIYWIQPGGQKVGDQVFGSYIGEYDGSDYIRSVRSGKSMTSMLWLAISTSTLGFICQFVGLRAMHASVILAQLGATLLMSIVRTILRTQRTDKTMNLIRRFLKKDSLQSSEEHPFISDPKLLHGHELDFFTTHIHNVGEVHVQVDPDSRLKSEYTGMTPRAAFNWDNLEVRKTARQLDAAMGRLLEILSTTAGPILTGASAREHNEWSVCLNISEPGSREVHKLNLDVGNGTSTMLQLEALLGLWAMSMNALQFRFFESAGANYTSSNDKKSLRMISRSADEFPCIHWQDYVHRGSLKIGRREVIGTKCGYVETNGGPYLPIFGSLEARPPDGRSYITYIETQNSPLRMCGQDIFMLFLQAVLKNVGSIGGQLEVIFPRQRFRQGTLWKGFGLQLSRVEALARCFEEAGLGSTEDAYCCILPVLMDLKMLPGPREVSSTITRAVEHWPLFNPIQAEDIYRNTLRFVVSVPPRGLTNGETKGERIAAMGNLLYCVLSVNPDFVPDLVEPDWWGVDFNAMLQTDPSSPIAQGYGWLIFQLIKTRLDDNARAKFIDYCPTADSDAPKSWKPVDWAKINFDAVFRYRSFSQEDYRSTDDTGKTALIWAALYNNWEMADAVFESVDQLHVDDSGRSALSYAAEIGFAQLVERLLIHLGPRANTCQRSTGDSKTPLMFAAENGHLRCVDLICQPQDVDLNATTSSGDSAMNLAIIGGHIDVIAVLIDSGAIFDEFSGDPESSPLMKAVQSGRESVVELLASRWSDELSEIDIDQYYTDSKGQNILHHATATNSKFIWQWLDRDLIFDIAAVMNKVDNEGKTPLDLAVESNASNSADFLLSRGASIGKPGQRSALRIAINCNNFGMVKKMIERLRLGLPERFKNQKDDECKNVWLQGADIDLKDNMNRTALHHAVVKGNEEIIKYLVDAGADVKARDNNDNYILHLEAESGGTYITKLLAQRHDMQSLTVKNRDGRTPLHVAAKGGHAAAVKALIAGKAPVDMKDNQGMAPVYYAIQPRDGYLEVVKLLLAAGVDISGPNKDGKQLWEEAHEKNLTDMETLLFDHQSKMEGKGKKRE